MISVTSSVKVTLSPEKAARVAALNANPRTRATAARHVNSGARTVIRFAQEIADDELKDRPENRRRSPGTPRYRDSFFVTEASFDSINRMRAGFGNRSPVANLIENGAAPHTITANPGGANSGNLVFPWDPPHSHSGPGSPPGDWPVTFEEGTRRSIFSVNHPGQAGFHIFRRARERYRARERGTRGSRRRL